MKQYKKGIKTADKILEKFPDHAGLNYLISETQSVKGLMMYFTGEVDEGKEVTKKV